MCVHRTRLFERRKRNRGKNRLVPVNLISNTKDRATFPGPDYFLYKSDVLRLDYDKNAGSEPQKLSAQTENTINKEIAELDLQLLEKKAKIYKEKV